MENNPFSQLPGIISSLNLSKFNWDIWHLIKIPILIGLFLYIPFSVMIVRQVDLMSRSLEGNFDAPLKFFAWLYLVATILVFLFALFFL